MRIKFENISSNTGSSFAVREKKERRFRGTYHFHPEIELTQIVVGRGLRLIGDDISSYSADDLVLIGRNLPHRYVSDGSSETMSHARVIQFSPEFLGSTFLDSAEMIGPRRLIAEASRGLCFSPKVVANADQILRQLFDSKGMHRLLLLLELLDLLASGRKFRKIASAGFVSNVDKYESNKINRAINYLNDNLQDPITLDEIAALLDVSPATCNRLFRKSLGKPFKDFLIEVRVSYACKLLLESSEPIINVAWACGFRNLSNFNRLFKTRKKKTPSAYRKHAMINGSVS